MRQNLHNRTRPRSYGNECPSHISKWSVKIYGCESANGDFSCAKWQTAKKIRQNIFANYDKTPEFISINMVTLVTLVTLA